MDGEIIYEFWDAELKNQSKERMKRLDRAIAQTGAIVVDRDECVIFEDARLKWRNPLLLKIKVPQRRRYEFMLAAKVWLAEPPRVAVCDRTNPDNLV